MKNIIHIRANSWYHETMLIVNWIINALAIFLTSLVLPGVTLDGFLAAFLVSLVLALVNIFIKPLVIILTLPATILTLGLFLFVINALMIMLVDAIVPGFSVQNFWWALLFSLILTVINSLLNGLQAKRV